MRYILFLALLLVFAAAHSASEKQPLVFVEKIKKTELFEQLSYPARVQSKINASIQAESEGVVLSLPVQLGAKVTRRTPIAVVQKTEPGLQYAPLRVLSPVDGYVSQLKVTVGSQVSRGQVLAQITDPAQVKVQIEITATDLKHFRKGLTGEFQFSGAANSATWPVEVVGVSPLVDPNTGTATAELKVLSTKNQTALPPGVVGVTRFKVNERQGFRVPEHALAYKGQQPTLRVVTDEKARRVPVTLGNKGMGMVEIESGIKEGDTVIVRSSDFVADGEKVKIQSADGEKAL